MVGNPNNRGELTQYDLLNREDPEITQQLGIAISMACVYEVDGKVPFAENAIFFDCRTWRNQAGPEMDAHSLSSGFHNVRRQHARG